MNRSTDRTADTAADTAADRAADRAHAIPLDDANQRADHVRTSARGMAEIEEDIRATRARMDATLDEIEFRLSPGQMSGGLIEVARDVVRGRPTRMARAIRGNPLPLVLIGVGVAWLAWTVSRTPDLEGEAYPGMSGALSDQRVRILLTGLVGVCRHGAESFQEADAAIADPLVSTRLMEISNQLERTSAALEHELRVREGLPDPEGPVHPAWVDVRETLMGQHSRPALLAALERGLDGTLAQFRDALHEDLPADLRVIVGAHFHDLETVRHRVGELREAMA